MKEAYPRVREYCYNELHVDFSVVDMRWGVTDDATNEHVTEHLCLTEIANCQRVGLGPTFVVSGLSPTFVMSGPWTSVRDKWALD